jgi:hypothetical protein
MTERRRKRPLTRKQRMRLGRMVTMVRVAIVVAIDDEKRLNLNTAEGRRAYVDRHRQYNDMLRGKFRFLPFFKETEVYVSDTLRVLAAEMVRYVLTGRTPLDS